MKKTYFTYQVIYSTRDIEKMGDHTKILNERLSTLNFSFNHMYDEMRVIGVMNELTFPDGNYLKKSIILLCEGIKKERDENL